MAKRKLNKVVFKQIGPLEYKEWKVGQKVYCHRHPDDKLSYGMIKTIHLDDTSGDPCFTFLCEMCGQFRLAMFDQIIDDPSKLQVNKKNRATK